ncbi:MAG TPA: hypothetical protein PLS43_10330 [Syntrophales bacterium]|jgi:hypothetical protein|nr:hypothetical protein [Syntrophales bacterium]HOH74019.1 hypothetical protein [Syntrophales bacterium]
MGSILRNTAGVINFVIPRDGVVVVAYDDGRTSVADIVKALEKGRFKLRGAPAHVQTVVSPPPAASPAPPTAAGLPLYRTRR